jgi:putative FmdB family regulatory protein
MPTYEYACTECGDRTEVVQSIADASLTTCTVCGGRLRKVFSPVGIVFKGSGFYRTDSRRKPKSDGDKAKKPADAKASSSESKTSSSDGGSSTSKPKAAEKSA